MPALINLKTDLKSLGYGDDRPGGASSNQPYIQTPIPEERALNSPDFLLRNGYLNAINSAQDVSRLTKYFIDTKSPNGILFTAKQELLERQNVNVSDGINRLYNPLGTIAQAGVLSTGYHLNKQGFNIFREGYYNGGKIGYFTITNTSNTLGEDRLSLLFKSKISNSANEFEILAGKNLYGITPSLDTVNLLSYSGGPGSTLGIGNTNIKLLNGTRPVENISEQNKFQPSYYSTLISDPKYLVVNNGLRPNINWKYNFTTTDYSVSQRAFLDIDWGSSSSEEQAYNALFPNDNSSDFALNRKDTPAPSINFKNSSYTFGRNQLLEQKSLGSDKFTSYASSTVNSDGEAVSTPGIKDFRQEIDRTTFNANNQDLAYTDYSIFNREKTYLDSVTTYRGNWKDGKRVINPNEWISPDQQEIGVTGEDIIDFNFNIISNDVPYPGDKENLLIDFRAYIEDWADSVKADWSSVKYMGRAENFYKYNGWSRDSSVSFIVPALSRGDMILNYNKLNALSWTVAPSYSLQGNNIPGVMRGSIVKFTMGNYFRGMPCIIKDVSFSEVKDMGWDINRDNYTGNIIKPVDETTGVINDNFTGQLPKGIKVQVNFTPIHNFVPQFGEPFIGDYSGVFPGYDNAYVSKLVKYIK